MAEHLVTGKEGEALAQQYLAENGFTILHCNWRYGRYEIDIIAQKDKILHFIEVKTRRSTTYGLPEESISTAKMKNLFKSGAAYQRQYPGWKRIQYDVLSIMLKKDKDPEFFFIKDVYL